MAAALERLLSRGVEPVRIAQALAPLYAAADDPAKHVAMLELLSRKSPPDADGRERARLLLDSASLRAERLGDPRGALDAAAAALRACPTHAEARRRAEELAAKVGAHVELYALLVEMAGRLEGRPDVERAVRMRAALLAEQELGKADDAAAQLARCLQLSPTDLEALAASTRVALAAERWEEAADHLLARTRLAQPAEKVALLAQLGEVLLERLHSPSAAADVFRQALDLAVLPNPWNSGISSPPTISLLPPLEGRKEEGEGGENLRWRLLAHFFLNYLSLARTENLKALLEQYIFPGSRNRTHTLANRKRIEGIEGLETKSSDRLVSGILMRGQEIELKMRQEKFASQGDMYLFGCIMDHFLGETMPRSITLPD